MDWNWAFALSILPKLAEGVKITVVASVLASALAMLIGLAIAIAQRSAGPAAGRVLRFFLEFVRGTPLLVQLYFAYYVLPDIGIDLTALTAGVLTLALHYSTYTAEVYRAGIDNVDRGLWEAARALNLTRVQAWRYIIIPTAVPPMLPALGNYVVAMFKETPLLATITVVELMGQAHIQANLHYRYLEPMTMVGVFFLAVSVPCVIALSQLERHYGSNQRRHRNVVF